MSAFITRRSLTLPYTRPVDSAMPGEAFLSTVAQVAITLAGFIGLVVTVQGRDTSLTLEGKKFILELSFAIAAAALLPFAVWTLWPRIVWRICSAGLGIYMIEAAWRHRRRARAMVARGDPPRTPRTVINALLLISAVVILGLGANTVRWNRHGMYEGALLWLLAVGCYQFAIASIGDVAKKPRVSQR